MLVGTLKSLEHFNGKVCTVFIKGQLSRSLTTEQFNDYFVGIVESINADGIFTSHPITGCKNWYPMDTVVLVSEEQMLDPSKPEEAKLIDEFKKRGRSAITPDVPQTESPFADIDVMAEIARQAKEKK